MKQRIICPWHWTWHTNFLSSWPTCAEKIMRLSRLASEKCLGYIDAEYGQIMLFSYDCLDKFHRILKRFFGGELDEISEETVNAFTDILIPKDTLLVLKSSGATIKTHAFGILSP